MKRECDNFAEDLSALIDGQLSAARRTEVEAHVAGCADCRRRVEELQHIIDGVASLPKIQPAPQFLAAVRRKIARGDAPRKWSWVDVLFRPAWLKLPLEALAGILILVGVMVHDRSQQLRSSDAPRALAKNAERGEGKIQPPPPTPNENQPAAALADRRDADQSRIRSEVASAPARENEFHAEPPPVAPAKKMVEQPKMAEQRQLATDTLESKTATSAGSELAKSVSGVGGDVLVVSNGAHLFFAQAPIDKLVVKSDDSESIRKQVEAAADSLKGSFAGAVNGQKFYVFLPAESVAEFKARITDTGNLRARQLTMEETRDFAAGEKTKDSVIFGTNQFSAAMSTNRVLLEIQVVPANR